MDTVGIDKNGFQTSFNISERAVRMWSIRVCLGADPDNLRRGYDGRHAKESSKSLQTRSLHGAFCSGIDSANYG